MISMKKPSSGMWKMRRSPKTTKKGKKKVKREVKKEVAQEEVAILRKVIQNESALTVTRVTRIGSVQIATIAIWVKSALTTMMVTRIGSVLIVTMAIRIGNALTMIVKKTKKKIKREV